MPQPPRCAQTNGKVDEAESRQMEHDSDVLMKATIDDVVQEFFLKISELSRLAANLPKRLHATEGGSCNGVHHVNSYHHSRDKHSVDVAIEEAAEHANVALKTEVEEEEARNTAGILTIAEHAVSDFAHDVVNMEQRVHEAVARMETLVIGEHCCSKISKMLCPAFVKNVMATAKKNDRDHLRDHLKKDEESKFSQRFDMIIGVLILANCLMMIVQLEYVGYQSEILLGNREEDGSWHNAETYFTVFEHIFNALFITELIIRFAIDGLKIFCDGSIVLDIVLVSGSSVQIYIFDPLGVDGVPGLNLSLFRMLRFVKFVKIFRLVRVLKLFSHLRVLVKTILSSMSALMWSMVLLFVIMIMSGMFLSGLLESYVADASKDLVRRKWVFKYYGTASRAVYTLFEVTFAGCWPNYFRPLIDEVSPWYFIFSVGYISVVVFAIMRIITAIFLKETLVIAGGDAEMMLQERVRQKEIYINKLKNVFQAVDTSGDGKLSLEEFSEIVDNPLVKVWLQLLEMEVHDATALFRLLDNGDGEITYDEFLRGVMRLKGSARSTDIVAVLHSTDKTLSLVSCIMENLLQVLMKLDSSPVAEGGLDMVRLATDVTRVGGKVKVARKKSWLNDSSVV